MTRTDILAEQTRSLAAEIVAAASREALTVAVAESLTGGLVCGALTAVPGCSAVLQAGIVAYQPSIKVSVLGVAAATIADHGVVSRPVAEEMAVGAHSLAGSDLAVATTGVAGPGPQDGVEAGTYCVAVAADERVHSTTGTAQGDREAVRSAAVVAALRMLLEHVVTARA